ncbi:TPA: LuxR C-terminal-related transcriptional regulator [Serratia fonticola]
MSTAYYNVGVIAPCHLFQTGLRAMLSTTPASLAWCRQDIAGAQLSLNEQSVNLLIVSLHVWQTDLLPALRFIQQVRASWPVMQLMVLLDIGIPYLVTCLQRLGVGYILSLTQSLATWQKYVHKIIAAECYSVNCDLPGCREEALSMTERNVVTYLLQGLSVSDIATLMMRSVKTISAQKSNAMYKMGIRHCAQLIAVQGIFNDSCLPLMSAGSRWDNYLDHPRLVADFINASFETRKYAQ